MTAASFFTVTTPFTLDPLRSRAPDLCLGPDQHATPPLSVSTSHKARRTYQNAEELARNHRTPAAGTRSFKPGKHRKRGFQLGHDLGKGKVPTGELGREEDNPTSHSSRRGRNLEDSSEKQPSFSPSDWL